MSDTIVTFTVPGIPVRWARAGRGGKFTFTPKDQRSFMADLKTIAADAMGGRPLFNGAVELSCSFVYAWPQSMSEKKRAAPGVRWKTSKPDGDNLRKLVGDGLNGVVWTDDSRVASGHDWKFYGPAAETRVVVRVLP